jgi:hypothetical protein
MSTAPQIQTQTDTDQTIIETQRRHYRAAIAGLTAADWSAQQLRSLGARLAGLTPAQCVSAARMLVAAQVNGEQAALLLDDAWGTLTELRHAIVRCRQNPQHQPAAPSQTARPSMDAQIAAEESCWAEHRAGRGQRPDADLLRARALQIEMVQRQANAAPSSQEPTQEKLSKARATLAEAERKVSQGRFTGRVEVEVRFLDLEGSKALVPSSTGDEPYLVLLRDGAAYQCACRFNVIRGLHCKHMLAAEAAYRACDAQPGTVLEARAQLIPRQLPRKARPQAACA